MPLIGTSWFFNAEVFPRARAFQKKTKGDKKYYQYKGEEGREIPLDQKEWNWFDQDYFNHYICNHTEYYYQFQRFFDAVGTETYAENSKFEFKCYAMPWSNDKIRVYYNIAQVKGECRAIFTNSAKGPAGKKFLTPEEETQVSFRRTADSRMQIF